MRHAQRSKARFWPRASWECACCWSASKTTVRQELARHKLRDLPIEVVNANDVITMTDSPSHAFRRKKESSLHVAARLVRDGKADALVSAGNTGAVMTVARFVLGTLPSVDRPALAAAFPNMKEKVSIILDVGANVDSKPEQIEQFAVMGEIYYRTIWGVKRPRVALLSIGEEEMKGNELTREAARFAEADMPLNFAGNVEGRDVFRGNVEVVVCDGFIGNIALKISEGVVEHIGGMLKKAIKSSLRSQLGYALSKRAFDDFRKRTDYSEYGGAPLLGVKRHHRDRPRPVESQRDEERHSRGGGTLPRARERENRTGAFRCRRHPGARLNERETATVMSKIAFLFPGQASQYRGHGPRPRREFPRIACGLRRGRRRAWISAFETLL